MQQQYARTVRGLSIATVVLSAIGIAIWLISIIAILIGGAVFTSPEFLYWAGEHSTSGYTYYEAHDAAAVAGVIGLSLGAVAVILFGGIVLSVVPLVAGVLGMKHSENPERYGTLFAWAIAGAIASFLGMGYIVTVLLIVSAVYITKMRNNPVVAQQVYGQQFAQPGSGVPFDQANQAYNPGYGPTGSGYGMPFVQPTPQPGQTCGTTPQAGQPYGAPGQAPYGAAPQPGQAPGQPYAAQPGGQPYPPNGQAWPMGGQSAAAPGQMHGAPGQAPVNPYPQAPFQQAQPQAVCQQAPQPPSPTPDAEPKADAQTTPDEAPVNAPSDDTAPTDAATGDTAPTDPMPADAPGDEKDKRDDEKN